MHQGTPDGGCSSEQLLKHQFTCYEDGDLFQATLRTCALLNRAFGTGEWSAASVKGEVEFVRSLYRRSSRLKGLFGGPVSPGDAVFLCECIRLLRPGRVIEIGVASGFSSLVILSAMQRHGLLGDHPGLISLDLQSQCDGDPSRRVGQVIDAAAPELKQWWSLHTEATTLDYLGWEPAREAPTLAFIDGGHAHPWPAIDLHVLSRRMPIGSWMIMQDIDLPTCVVIASLRKSRPAGPGWLGAKIAYEHWAGPKVRGLDACFNMGAVQLAPDLDTVDRGIQSTLKYPLERPTTERVRSYLRDELGANDPVLRPPGGRVLALDRHWSR